MLAHLVVPHGDDMVDDEVFYVSGHDEHRDSWDSSPHAPMTITRVLGQWTRLVPYRPLTRLPLPTCLNNRLGLPGLPAR